MTYGTNVDIKSLIDRLPVGKVLDVSAMQNNGAGIRTIQKPVQGRTAYFSVEGLPIVSTNFENYSRAIQLLGPGYEQFLNYV